MPLDTFRAFSAGCQWQTSVCAETCHIIGQRIRRIIRPSLTSDFASRKVMARLLVLSVNLHMHRLHLTIIEGISQPDDSHAVPSTRSLFQYLLQYLLQLPRPNRLCDLQTQHSSHCLTALSQESVPRNDTGKVPDRKSVV